MSSGMFGGDEIAKGQRQQQQMYNKALKKTKKSAEKWGERGLGYIDTALANVENSPANLAKNPITMSTPGYGIQLNSSGGIINRSGETQSVMDALLSGMGTDETAYSNLLGQIQPGFGRLSQATLQDIENQSRAAVGNLREQLARRRVLGASFANDQLAGLKATYDQMREKALAENFVQEMEMTKQVIAQRTEARNAAVSQAFNQIQFEGDQGQKYAALIMANNQDMAKLQGELAVAGAQVASNTGGQIVGAQTQLGSTMLGTAPTWAQMNAEAAAGPATLIGTLGGALAGNSGLFGGTK